MSKIIIAGFTLLIAGSSMAEINCLAERGVESISIKVIDTFVDRTAFISRTHPSIRYPIVGISVQAQEKSKSVVFLNEEQDFHLAIDKLNAQRRLPATYKALLNFGEVAADMECNID